MSLVKAFLRIPYLLLVLALAAASFGVGSSAVLFIDIVLYQRAWTGAHSALLAALVVLCAAFTAHRTSVSLRIALQVVQSLRQTLPGRDSQQLLFALDEPVTVHWDRHGIALIHAQSRADAFRALGYVTARDRMFQMDLLRRASAGRLSEIFGPDTLSADIRQRVLGFNRVCEAILNRLPENELSILRSYADGVNSYMQSAKYAPFECLMLRYSPEPWRVQDSILIMLAQFQMLCDSESDERMLTIMERSLPPDITAFLTPDTDAFTSVLIGGDGSARPIMPIPVASLIGLLEERQNREPPPPSIVQPEPFPIGSNSWAVDSSLTRDGKAILANDMHLPLTVPNIWHRASLRYGTVDLSGVLVPGLPVIGAGCNGHVAWGLTNAAADCLDLVELETRSSEPGDAVEYKTAQGWRQFGLIDETIYVRGRAAHTEQVRTTIWGPVSPRSLMGRMVAIRWTALDPDAVNLAFVNIDGATTIDDAVRILRIFAGPPMNVLLADDTGQIAWTLSGKIPLRKGFDGSSARCWAKGDMGWVSYLTPKDLPGKLAPESGFLVTANNRTTGNHYPYLLGHNFDYSYRAYRITERLREMTDIDENDMRELQLDVRVEVFDFYRDVALKALDEAIVKSDGELTKIHKELAAWDGMASRDSRAMGILVRFRSTLARRCLAPFLAPCLDNDPEFKYRWGNMETPLRQLLTERPAVVLPEPGKHDDWGAFILSCLRGSLRESPRPASLKWGDLNRAKLQHPVAGMFPAPIRALLNLPRDPLAGSRHCVRVATSGFGATVRMVVSPGSPECASIAMPGGQSGHPLLQQYCDMQRAWVLGERGEFQPGPTVRQLLLIPARCKAAPADGCLGTYTRPTKK